MLFRIPKNFPKRFLCLVAALSALTGAASAQTSNLVHYGTDGRLVYQANSRGDVVPDFSGVGYRNGEASIPTIPVVKTVTAVSGDNTSNIQSAINQVAAMSVQSNGFRGAILFKAGTYNIGSRINITVSGIVLRGEGAGSGGTNFVATGTSQYDLIRFAGGGVSVNETTRKQITGSYVPIGTKQVTVQSGHSFVVGDAVNLYYVPNSAWINLIGMQDYWVASDYDYNSERRVTGVSGNVITLDAPLMQSIDSRYATASLVKISGDSRLENCGIEDLRLTSNYDSSLTEINDKDNRLYYIDEDHGWSAVIFDGVKNSWARNLEAYHFGYSCVNIDSDDDLWITVDSCKNYDPVSLPDGGRRYSFANNGQRSLVMNCYARRGRHDYVSGSHTAGPNVAYNCVSDDAVINCDSGPHHRWTVGGLYDRITSNMDINVQNRMGSGTGHGWAGGQIMLWNCTDRKTILQQPAGPHINWAIGHIGTVTNVGQYTTTTLGVVESQGTHIVDIPSLYLAQLSDRLGVATPTFNPPAGTYSSAQSVTISSSTPGVSIRYTTNGSTPSSTNGTLYTGPVAINSTTTLKAVAYANGYSDSGVATATYTIGTSSDYTVSSTQGFYNTALSAAQTGTFSAEFDASVTDLDATIALCQGSQTAYSGLAVIVRFNDTGTIDARNGGAYAAANSIPYTPGLVYHFRLVVNVPNHTYSAYVTPSGGSEITIGTNYAFRTEQAGVTQLNTLNLDVNTGSITVSPPVISTGLTGTTVTAADGFYNTALSAAQTGTFVAQFDASLTNSDGTIALCQGNQTAYSGLAVIVRFNSSGTIDARNGGAYAAANTIPYTPGAIYHFRLVVNVPAHTYSAYVTPQGGSELTIGTNYAFRTEQAGVTQLNTLNLDVNAGSITVTQPVISISSTPVWSHAGPTTFNGTTTYVDGGTSAGSAASLTVAFYATPSQLASMQPVDKLPTTGNAGWSVKMRSNGDLWFRIGSEGTHTDLVATGVYTANTKVHIACTFTSGTAKIYVNGVLRATATGIAYTVNNTGTNLRLGIPSVAATTNIYAGVLSGVKIYSSALAASDIATLATIP